MRASIVDGGKYVHCGAGFPCCSAKDVLRRVSGVDTDVFSVGQVYGREAAVSVLHHVPEALRVRGTCQAAKVCLSRLVHFYCCHVTHDSDTVFSLRPTHARVERLEEELRQLKGSTSASPPPQEKSVNTPAPVHDDATSSNGVKRSSNSAAGRYTTIPHNSWTPTTGPSTPGGPSSTYHGPTSASHDGAVHERRPHRWFTAEREALMPNLLFAAAARQRELIIIRTID